MSLSTKGVIRELNQRPGLGHVRVWHLRHVLNAQLIIPPPLNDAHQFVWSEEHIDALANVLMSRRSH